MDEWAWEQSPLIVNFASSQNDANVLMRTPEQYDLIQKKFISVFNDGHHMPPSMFLAVIYNEGDEHLIAMFV
jgi:hypothetical protein